MAKGSLTMEVVSVPDWCNLRPPSNFLHVMCEEFARHLPHSGTQPWGRCLSGTAASADAPDGAPQAGKGPQAAPLVSQSGPAAIKSPAARCSAWCARCADARPGLPTGGATARPCTCTLLAVVSQQALRQRQLGAAERRGRGQRGLAMAHMALKQRSAQAEEDAVGALPPQNAGRRSRSASGRAVRPRSMRTRCQRTAGTRAMTCLAGTGSRCRPWRQLLDEMPQAYRPTSSKFEPGLASFRIRSFVAARRQDRRK